MADRESAIKARGFQTVRLRRLTCPRCGRLKIVLRVQTGAVKCAGCGAYFK